MANSRPRHRDKDYESLFQKAERNGWRVSKTRKNHFRLQCPSECGKHTITAPSTPSDHRALKNFKASMRKCERSVI